MTLDGHNRVIYGNRRFLGVDRLDHEAVVVDVADVERDPPCAGIDRVVDFFGGREHAGMAVLERGGQPSSDRKELLSCERPVDLLLNLAFQRHHVFFRNDVVQVGMDLLGGPDEETHGGGIGQAASPRRLRLITVCRRIQEPSFSADSPSVFSSAPSLSPLLDSMNCIPATTA